MPSVSLFFALLLVAALLPVTADEGRLLDYPCWRGPVGSGSFDTGVAWKVDPKVTLWIPEIVAGKFQKLLPEL